MNHADTSKKDKQANSDKLLSLIRGHEDGFPWQMADRFPAILEKIVAVWENPVETRAYLQQLMVTRRELRQGFPEEVYKEIFSLYELYNTLHPGAEQRTDDFWSWVNPKE
jgi:hypothetical protein